MKNFIKALLIWYGVQIVGGAVGVAIALYMTEKDTVESKGKE